MPEELVCSKCAAGQERTPLVKCPMCFRSVCGECQYLASGRNFCSSACAQFFFFEDEEES